MCVLLLRDEKFTVAALGHVAEESIERSSNFLPINLDARFDAIDGEAWKN